MISCGLVIVILSVLLAGECVLIYISWKIIKHHEVDVTPEEETAIRDIERKRIP